MTQETRTFLLDPPAEDKWIQVGFYDVVAMSCHVLSDEVDLWELYTSGSERFRAQLIEQVQECFGSDMEIVVDFNPGSLWMEVVARFKNAWTATGQRVSSAARAVKKKLNIGAVENKVRELLGKYCQKIKGFLISPKMRITYAVFATTIHIGSAVAEVSGFLTPGTHSLIASVLSRWAGPA